MKTSKCVGIDLGTTNSVIAMMADDNITIKCNEDKARRKTFPSVIVYDARTDSIKAGQIAFNRRGTSPEPIVSIKRHMGDENYRATCGPLSLSPVEVSAEILRAMKEKMQDYLSSIPEYSDYVVDRAVITIPAYFAANARAATTQAGELAGLKVEFTLQEPTASALYYCFKNKIDDGIFMVYDLGGGTFDVSIVRMAQGNAYVLGIAGNNYLGGDNFDEALAYHLLKILQDPDEGYDLDLDVNHDEEDRLRFTRLKLEAEIIKKALTSKDEHFENVDGLFKDKSGASVNLTASITREEFEGMIQSLLETTIEECNKALIEAEEKHGVTLGMIDGVLLVGGSTHIPAVSKIIEKMYTDPGLPVHTKMPKPLKDEPDMAVGYGAAIAAASCGVVSAGAEIVSHEGQSLQVSASFNPGRGYAGISIVEGNLTAVTGTLPDGIYAKVQRAAGGFSREYLVNEDGSFIFDELMSTQEKEPYACEFYAGNTLILSTSFDAAVLAVGEMPVVLSRNYYIQTLNENTGALQFVKLMEKGTQLPCSKDYEFEVNSKNPYYAELRFFEESEFLKKVTMMFDPPIPQGTAIRLSLACDIASRFTARAEAAGVVVNVIFEQSPPPELPTQDEVDALVHDVQDRIAMIPKAGERIVAQTMLTRIVHEIEQAIDEEDACKAVDKMTELRKVGGITISHGPLMPTKQEFGALIASVKSLNETSEKGGAEIETEIASAAALGYRAYDNEDQTMLTKAVNDLEAIKNLIKPDKGEQPHPPMWLICQIFAKQGLEFIEVVESTEELPTELKKKLLASAPEDRKALRDVMNATRFMLSDEDCVPHMNVLRKVYPKWEEMVVMIKYPVPTSGKGVFS